MPGPCGDLLTQRKRMKGASLGHLNSDAQKNQHFAQFSHEAIKAHLFSDQERLMGSLHYRNQDDSAPEG